MKETREFKRYTRVDLLEKLKKAGVDEWKKGDKGHVENKLQNDRYKYCLSMHIKFEWLKPQSKDKISKMDKK